LYDIFRLKLGFSNLQGWRYSKQMHVQDVPKGESENYYLWMTRYEDLIHIKKDLQIHNYYKIKVYHLMYEKCLSSL
jgi:hypothetical protein